MKVLQVLATVLIINAIPEYDIHIYWQYCRTRKGITFLPFTRREPFIPIIPWGSGLEYLLSTYHLFVVHGD